MRRIRVVKISYTRIFLKVFFLYSDVIGVLKSCPKQVVPDNFYCALSALFVVFLTVLVRGTVCVFSEYVCKMTL